MTMLQRAKKVGRKYQNAVPTTLGGFGLMAKVLPLYLRNKEEKTPAVAPGPFQTEVALFATPPANGLRVTWFGHSGSLVEIDGLRVLIDPIWDERAGPVTWAGPKRFFPPTMRLEQMPRIDVVLISHDHYDHLGKRTVKALVRTDATRQARWVTSLGVGRLLRKFGVDRVTELDWTQGTVVAGVELGAELAITALPARHFAGRTMVRNQTLWSSFVLRGTTHTIYYGADSGWWDGFAEIGREYGPFDLTMLEIGAYHPLWANIHLGPDGAVQAFEALGGGLLMPIHWGLFDLALHAWRWPIERLLELAIARGLRLWTPEPGRPTVVAAGQEVRSDWWR